MDKHFFLFTDPVADFYKYNRHVMVKEFTLYAFASQNPNITWLHAFPEIDIFMRPAGVWVQSRPSYYFRIKNK